MEPRKTSALLRAGATTAVLAGLMLGGATAGKVAAQGPPSLSSNATVLATGLARPRGLRFGPDGNLYVAEAGNGGSTPPSTSISYSDPCLPVGPEIHVAGTGYSGRISKIDAAGHVTTVVGNLPSTSVLGDAVGPADVEFLNGVLYGLLDSGCNYGQRDVPGGIIQVANDASWNLYPLSTFFATHPPAKPDPGDYTPNGDPYAMTQCAGKLYAVNPNGGQIAELTPNTASVREVADLSNFHSGWVGPTGIACYNGSLYLSTLGEFPAVQGAQQVLKVGLDGTVSVYASGLTAANSLAFDSKGQLYATELFTGVPAPGPSAVGTGQLVRVVPGGAPVTVATGLSFPGAVTIGPDGNAYVSNFGAAVPNAGQIVKVNLSASS